MPISSLRWSRILFAGAGIIRVRRCFGGAKIFTGRPASRPAPDAAAGAPDRGRAAPRSPPSARDLSSRHERRSRCRARARSGEYCDRARRRNRRADPGGGGPHGSVASNHADDDCKESSRGRRTKCLPFAPGAPAREGPPAKISPVGQRRGASANGPSASRRRPRACRARDQRGPRRSAASAFPRSACPDAARPRSVARQAAAADPFAIPREMRGFHIALCKAPLLRHFAVKGPVGSSGMRIPSAKVASPRWSRP